MKPIPKIKVTQELKDYYKRVGLFLKNNPTIKSRKLALGFEVDISTIPKIKEEEWIEITKQ